MVSLRQYYDYEHQSLVASEDIQRFLRVHLSHWNVENGRLVVDDSPEMERLSQMLGESDSLSALEAGLKAATYKLIVRLLPSPEEFRGDSGAIQVKRN